MSNASIKNNDTPNNSMDDPVKKWAKEESERSGMAASVLESWVRPKLPVQFQQQQKQ